MCYSRSTKTKIQIKIYSMQYQDDILAALDAQEIQKIPFLEGKNDVLTEKSEEREEKEAGNIDILA